MHLVQILLLRTDNNGQPFESEEYDRVKEDLASSFDGVTAYLRAEGLWRERPEASHDEIVIFEVMTDDVDLTPFPCGSWRAANVMTITKCPRTYMPSSEAPLQRAAFFNDHIHDRFRYRLAQNE